VCIQSPSVLPVIDVLSATYGHPASLSKGFDVSTRVRNLIEQQGGDRLVIDTEQELASLFQDPCRGVRKRLHVTYVTRGLNGSLQVEDVSAEPN
jgi:hypothetical protein